MNKIINHPDNMIKEMLEGYLSIYPGLFDKVDAPNTNGLMVHDHGDKVSIGRWREAPATSRGSWAM